MNGFLQLGVVGLLAWTSFAFPRAALACGGGVGPDVDEPAAVSAQRVFISAHSSGTTDVAVQLDVTGSADFGILLPVPAEPVLDSEPIPTAEFDALDAATQVHFVDAGSGSGSSGFGCGSSGDAGAGKDEQDEGVAASSFVDIGPVTAVVLSAENAEALSGWLSEHDFSIPPAHQAMVDSYVGAGKYFIAFKRSANAGEARSSVGVHFTMPGDQRGYPLRMAGMGATHSLAVTVFLANPSGLAAASPFKTLTIDNLPAVEGSEASAIGQSYTEAIRSAVADRKGKAFVIEGVYDANQALGGNAPRLLALTDDGNRISRLTTVLDPSMIDTDVTFNGAAPEVVPTSRQLGAEAEATPASKALLYLLLLPALVAGSRRRFREV